MLIKQGSQHSKSFRFGGVSGFWLQTRIESGHNRPIMIDVPDPENVTHGSNMLPMFAAMYFPSSVSEQKIFLDLAQSADRNWVEGEPISEIFEATSARLARSRGQSHVAGTVAVRLIQVAKQCPPPSINKAAQLTAEYFARPENISRKGKPFTSDASDVRKAFRRFKNSVHFSAAWVLLNTEAQRACMNVEIPALVTFAKNAALMERQLEATGCMGEWEPNKLPPSYYKPGWRLTIGGLVPWEMEMLATPGHGRGT